MKVNMVQHIINKQKYEEPELNCCSNLLNYLENDLSSDFEDEYDIALHNINRRCPQALNTWFTKSLL